jgi:hypothetical protein
MKLYQDTIKREMARAITYHFDDTYRRPYAWTISWLISPPDGKSYKWAIRRYWEALGIEQNGNAAWSLITH